MNIRKKCLNGFSLEQSLKEVILFEVSTLLFEKQFVWDFVSFCVYLDLNVSCVGKNVYFVTNYLFLV